VKRKLKGLNHIFHIKVQKKCEFVNEWERYKISSIRQGRETRKNIFTMPLILTLEVRIIIIVKLM